ncbi:MAG: ROK family protein [Phycisphaerae bacterium]|nr:ROK family protein [Phycisphaerae bacterium]
MSYDNDQRTVVVLDAGGTNFIFSAIRGNKEVVKPVRHDAHTDSLELCLETLKQGFQEAISELGALPDAISFAFPGPADYPRGIIGDLPNFPSFRGGVALGPMLEAEFSVPVFINNDGSLFAYGEALAGVLPDLNQILERNGQQPYKHLLGVTFGTGFGGGVVVDNELLIGDNSCGGHIWCFRNKKYSNCIVEESVSIRAVCRVYAELSGDRTIMTPEAVFYIAEGMKDGDKDAAQKSFQELGEMAGDAIAHAITLVDGIVVIGGGLAGAYKYIIPPIVNELNSELGLMDGTRFPRLPAKAYDLTDSKQFNEFITAKIVNIAIPGTGKLISYEPERKIGVTVSQLGTSMSVALGAYAFALHRLDSSGQGG